MSPYSVKRIVDRRAEEAVRRLHRQRLLREARRAQSDSALQPFRLLLRGSCDRLLAAACHLRRHNPVESLPLDERLADRR